MSSLIESTSEHLGLFSSKGRVHSKATKGMSCFSWKPVEGPPELTKGREALSCADPAAPRSRALLGLCEAPRSCQAVVGAFLLGWGS